MQDRAPSVCNESAAVLTSAQFLESMGLPGVDLWSLPDSAKRFPDGCHYRLEIPSTEGPRCLEAVIEAGEWLGVPIHRVSQGSGVYMLTDSELDQMVVLGSAKAVEVSLFARPDAASDASAMARSDGGSAVGAAARGQAQLAFALDDIRRAADHGIRSVLVSDIGVLAAFSAMRGAGLVPGDMQAKVSVMLPVANAAAASVIERLGAGTINLATDLTLAQIAAIRQAVDVSLDIYVEVPDTIGGFSRLHEIPDLIRIAAPVYLKFGVRNAPNIYPAGGHLEGAAIALSRERVRRARLGMEMLYRNRFAENLRMSQVGAIGHALPQPHGSE